MTDEKKARSTLHIEIDPAIRKQLKAVALENDISIRELLTSIITEFLNTKK